MASTHTFALTCEQLSKLRQVISQRAHFEPFEVAHAVLAVRQPGLVLVVYQKGPKLVVQGKEAREFIEFVLEPEVLGKAVYGYEELHEPSHFAPHFGIDESGKGDYFGPLVIAGVYVDSSVSKALLAVGVMDSKRVGSARRIKHLAEAIRAVPGLHEAVVSIGPKHYNELYSRFQNLNRLLAWGHAEVCGKLAAKQPDCPLVICDQFASNPLVLERAMRAKGLQLKVVQQVRAEVDPAVAAASILARERFVQWLEEASRRLEMKLPLGASQAVVEAGRKLVAEKGKEFLGLVAKLHFQTTNKLGTHSNLPP